MNLPRTLDNEKLDKPTSGPIPQSLKQTAGWQDDDLVVFSFKPLINKVVSLMPFLFHWVTACRLVSLQAGIHFNFVMGLNRLLKTHCIPWWVDLFCQLTRCQDGDMPPCKHKKQLYIAFTMMFTTCIAYDKRLFPMFHFRILGQVFFQWYTKIRQDAHIWSSCMFQSPHFRSSTCYMFLVASLMGLMASLVKTSRML